MTISEKVAYLKGLADGMKIDAEKSDEGKLLREIIDVLEEVGLSIEDLEENTVALGEEIDALSDDLSDVEDVVFEDEDDEDPCCGCGEDFFEIECPHCGETLVIDESMVGEDAIECPHCKEKIALCDCGDED